MSETKRFVAKKGLLLKPYDGIPTNEVLMATPEGYVITGATISDLSNSAHTHISSELLLKTLTPYKETAHEYLNTMTTSGIISGGIITYNGDSTINVSSIYGLIRTGPLLTDEVVYYDISAQTNVAITTGLTNYIYVDYNSGNPIVLVSTIKNFNLRNTYAFARIYVYDNDIVFIEQSGLIVTEPTKNTFMRFYEDNLTRTSGLEISSSGLNFSVTSGNLYEGIRKIPTDLKNSGETFTYNYDDGTGLDWIHITGQTQIDPNHWDDNTGTLQTTTNGYYVNHYVYVDVNNNYYVVYGQNQYKYLSNAHTESIIKRNNEIKKYSVFLGRFTSKQGTTDLITDGAFEESFAPILENIEHNSLSNINGGASDEYYHFNSTNYNIYTTNQDATGLHHHNLTYYTQTQIDDTFATLSDFNTHTGLTGATNPHAIAFDDLTLTSHTHLSSDIYNFATEVISAYGSITEEPTGFPNRTDSIISFNDVTRTFTIQPTGSQYKFYVQGKEFIMTGATSIQITDENELHRIYFDVDGVLKKYNPGPFDLSLVYTKAYVSEIYWNVEQQKVVHFGDERHGMQMPGATHAYLHLTLGAVWQEGLELSNFNIGNGNLNSDIQFSVNDGIIRDEDITHNIVDGSPQDLSPILNAPIFYLSGSSSIWFNDDETSFVIQTGGTGRIVYNDLTGGIYSKKEVDNSGYTLVHLFATNDVDYPIYPIMGQNQYSTLDAAKEGIFNEIYNLNIDTLPTVEFVKIGTIVFQTSDSFSNDYKSKIVMIDGLNYINWIGEQDIISHSNLSNLDEDDHKQYALLNGRNGDILKIDSITEYTTNNGINIENIILKDNNLSATTIYSDNIYTSGITSLGYVDVVGYVSASTLYGELPFTSTIIGTTNTNVRGTLDELINNQAKLVGTGTLTDTNFLVQTGLNSFRVLGGKGYVNNDITNKHISWSQQDFSTTGYSEATYYVYVDINNVINISIIEPNYYLNVHLGGFFHDGSKITAISNGGRVISDFSTNVLDYMKHMGLFIFDDGGLILNNTGTTQIYSTACKVQQLTRKINLGQITYSDLGVKWFSYLKTIDADWITDPIFYRDGLVQTTRWNDVNGESDVSLSGNCSFTNGSNIVNTSVDLTSDLSINDLIWKSGDTSHVYLVSAITSTQITLDLNYGGTTQTTVGKTNTSQVPLTSGYYTKHLILRTISDKMIIIYGQEEFATKDDALAGALPGIPDSINLNSMKMSYIIVQEGDTDLDGKIYDIRPLPFTKKEGGQLGGGSGGGGVTDHGELLGLGDDDHLQYLLTNGNRDITGIIDYSTHPAFTNDNSLIDKKYADDADNLRVKYTDSVTSLSDVNSVGSGSIITTTERNNLHNHTNKIILDNISATTSDILTYNGTPVVTGLTQLGDVNLISPIVEEILKFNGTTWVNSDPVYTKTETDNKLTSYSLTSHTHDQIISGNSYVDVSTSDILLVTNNNLIGNLNDTDITLTIDNTSTFYMSSQYFYINATDTVDSSSFIVNENQILLSAKTNNVQLYNQPDGNDDFAVSTTKYVDDSVSAITSAILQSVRTTDGSLPNANTWYDISFDLKDIENQPTIISLSADTIEYLVHEDGEYLVSYDFQVTDSTSSYFNSRVLKNNTTEIPASKSYVNIYSNEVHMLIQSFVANFVSGDTFRLQLQCENNNATYKAYTTFSAIKQDSIKGKDGLTGPSGATGLPGADGDITWEGDWVSQNYTTNQAVSYLGSSYVCHTNTTNSQIPTDTNYWNILAKKGDDGSGSSIIVKKDGTTIGTTTEKINFTGNVTATDSGSLETLVNINYLDVESGGTSINSSTDTINYIGNGVESVVASTNTTTVNVEKYYLGELQVEDTVGGQNVNSNSYTILNFDSSFLIDTNYFTKVSDSRYRVLNDGLYEISYNIYCDSNHNGRSTPISSIFVNGTEILKTRVSSYSRNTTDDTSTNSLPPVYLNLSANDYIELQSIKGGTSGTVNTVANCNWLKIKYKS